MIKEACVENYNEAILAERMGASRLELCDNLAKGGTTPSFGTILKTLNDSTVRVFVMIRPRSGNFVYSEEERDIMASDISVCKDLGIPGVVLGLLTNSNEIDYINTEKLVKLAYPMEVTFHKAIDLVSNPAETLPLLHGIGIKRVLSSGGAATALEGLETLKKMEAMGLKHGIKLIAAGKVTAKVADELIKELPQSEFHGKQILT